MCGLYGSVGFAPDPARIDIVAHRGPDGRGWQVFESASGPVALGHRRLAIIGLSEAGLQPMADPTGRYRLVFNGEIYNYLELRETLLQQGEVFTTDTDSEVLLRAYIRWGQGALERLRGMFAFLIWDGQDKRLFAARDRYGIKPLYLYQGAGGVAFASEIKQLLGLPGQSGRMNRRRVRDFLASGLSDHLAETMFDGVLQIRGGECAFVDTAGGRPGATITRWYPATAGDIEIDEAQAGERFRDLLADSVRLHLRADVPVGSCLSGGLDSSAIVCLMTRRFSETGVTEPVNTVSACYEDKSVDEKPFMDAVVAHAGTRPHFIFPRPEDVFRRASDITWHQDEPFGSTSIFAQWCVFEEARRAGVKVMLDGQGADEQLAGYHGGYPFHMADLIRRGRLLEFARTVGERRRFHGTPPLAQIKHALVPLLPAGIARRLRGRHDALTQRDWLNGALFRGAPAQPRGFEAGVEALGLPPVSDVRSLCLALTYASNLPMLLHWEDRNSMAHAIEARVPFLDHPLVEFSLGLGSRHKLVGGDTKRVLRTAMADILPEQVRQRRDKLGFATPEQGWFRGPLRGLIEDGVEATLKRYPGLLNDAGVRALARDMLDGRRPVDFRLWRVVSLGLWGERFGVGV